MIQDLAANMQASPRASAAMAFGVRLRALRQRRGHSQHTLGREIFYSREYVALVERGLRPPTATFVTRAETALHAGGELQREFAYVEQAREREAQRRATAPRVPRRRSKIMSAADALCTVHGATTASEPSAAWWTALDVLQHVLQDEIEPHDAEAEVVDLERRWTTLAARSDGETPWADIATEAALGMAGAGALLQRSLHGDHVARLVTIARAFGRLAGDALMMLGRPGSACAWQQLADTVGHRAMRPKLGAEPASPDAAESAVHAESPRRCAPPGRYTVRAARRMEACSGRPASQRPSVYRRHRRRWEGGIGRAPPDQDCGMYATSSRDPFGSSTNVA
nr:hypothetical protein GCM10020063_009790 [Dactylosporangium thailandense]